DLVPALPRDGQRVAGLRRRQRGREGAGAVEQHVAEQLHAVQRQGQAGLVGQRVGLEDGRELGRAVGQLAVVGGGDEDRAGAGGGGGPRQLVEPVEQGGRHQDRLLLRRVGRRRQQEDGVRRRGRRRGGRPAAPGDDQHRQR